MSSKYFYANIIIRESIFLMCKVLILPLKYQFVSARSKVEVSRGIKYWRENTNLLIAKILGDENFTLHLSMSNYYIYVNRGTFLMEKLQIPYIFLSINTQTLFYIGTLDVSKNLAVLILTYSGP